MVKNTTSAAGSIKVDECYICGGKFLDHIELNKIRNEFKNDKSRTDAAIQYLYKQVGQELHEIDREIQTRKANRNLGQKLFYSIMGM